MARISALPQEERCHGLAHRRLADRLLVAALVQKFARAVDAEGAEIVLDAGLDAEIGIGRDGRAKFLADRRRDALRGGPGMIDARLAAGDVDAQRNVAAQCRGPGNLRARLSSCAR